MADNVSADVTTTETIAADEVNDGTLGSCKVQFVKLMSGVLDNTTKLGVYAEDAAHTSADTGIFALVVRQDTAASLCGTDGDYTGLIVDSSGRLHVNVGNTVTVASHAVTNAGTFAVQVDGAALTALQLIDDVVFAEDAGHTTGDKGVQVLTVRKDTAAALAGTDADYQPPISNARGATWVAIEDGAGGQITSFGGGTQYTEADIDASITGTAAMWEDSSDTLRAVSMAKPLPIQPGTSVTFTAVGGAAHDAAVSGNPVRIGAKAETAVSGVTLVAGGDQTDLICGEDGALFVRDHPAHPADYIDATPTTITSSTSDTSVVSAGGVNVRVYITGAVVANKSATYTRVSLKDGLGGTVKAILPAPASGGGAFYFNPPLRGTANTAWHAACADSVDSIYVTLLGYKSKV